MNMYFEEGFALFSRPGACCYMKLKYTINLYAKHFDGVIETPLSGRLDTVFIIKIKL